jgi:hypothetical protein
VNKSALDAILKSCTQLRVLYIGGGSKGRVVAADIVDTVVSNISTLNINLVKLEIGRSTINDEQVQILSKTCTNLLKLNMNFCNQITDAAIEALSTGCTKLTTLHIRKCANITFYAVNYLSVGTPDLTFLDISKCSAFPASQAPIIRLPKLEILKLVGCSWVTDMILMAIAQGCPVLQELNLDGINTTDAAVALLSKRCHLLRSLNLSQEWHTKTQKQVTDASIKMLGERCPKLQYLNLSGCAITSDALPLFTQYFPNLNKLILPEDATDHTQRAALRKQRPLLSVSVET